MDVEPQDLIAQIDEKAAPLIVDVRSSAEFASGHVPGARHMPFWAAPFRAGELGPHDQPIVVYCGHGPRAHMAASALRAHGFTNVRLLRGHMAGWRSRGLRTERV